jgi:hypothetical protein
MNYSYEIENKSLGFLIVSETINNNQCKSCKTFSFNQLRRNNEKNFIDYKYLKSYLRTKKWLEENHPELMI